MECVRARQQGREHGADDDEADSLWIKHDENVLEPK